MSYLSPGLVAYTRRPECHTQTSHIGVQSEGAGRQAERTTHDCMSDKPTAQDTVNWAAKKSDDWLRLID